MDFSKIDSLIDFFLKSFQDEGVNKFSITLLEKDKWKEYEFKWDEPENAKKKLFESKLVIHNFLISIGNLYRIYFNKKILTRNKPFKGDLSITFGDFYYYTSEGEKGKEKITKRLNLFYDLLFFILKTFNIDHIAAGVEFEHNVPSSTNLQLMCFKDKKYLDFLQKHVKLGAKLDLSKKELETLIKESKPTIIKKYGYTLISWAGPKDRNKINLSDNSFYQLIRKKYGVERPYAT